MPPHAAVLRQVADLEQCAEALLQHRLSEIVALQEAVAGAEGRERLPRLDRLHVQALLRSAEHAEAAALARKAIAWMKEQGRQEEDEHCWLLIQLARIEERLNEDRRAEESAREALRCAGSREKLRAPALETLARPLFRQGRMAESESCAEEALALFRKLGDPLGQANALLGLSLVRVQHRGPEGVVPLLEEGRELARRVGDTGLEAAIANGLAITFSELGDYGRAISAEEECVSLNREAGNRYGELVGLFNLAVSHFRIGNLEDALRILEESRILAVELGARKNEALALARMGEVYAAMGLPELARGSNARAVELLRGLDDPVCLAETLVGSANLLKTQERYAEAQRFAAEAQALLEPVGAPAAEAGTLLARGQICAAAGETDEARVHLGKALQLASQAKLKHPALVASLALARLETDHGEKRTPPAFEEDALEEIRTTARVLKCRREEYEALRLLARFHRHKGNFAEALEHTENAHQLWRSLREEETDRLLRHQQLSMDMRLSREQGEELRRSEAEKAQMLANVCHEIRNALNGVMGMSRLLAATEIDEQQQDYVQTLAGASESLLRMLNDMLDLSRIEAGHFEIDRVPFDPVAVLREVAALVEHASASKGLILKCSIPAPAPGLRLGDAVRLRQVLLNLASNAVKFTDHGTVTLALTSDANETGELVFEVSDTGTGIPTDRLPHLFDPYTQFGDDSSRRTGGSGLGLSLCRKLTEVMQGRLSVESREGEGSRFQLRLPAPPVQAAAAVVPKSFPRGRIHALPPCRILVADDDPLNRKVSSLFLEQLGQRATLVEDGEAALEAISRVAFDLVLLDVRMPVMDGLAACREIVRRLPEDRRPRLVAVTAGVTSTEQKRCLEAGFVAVLEKPILLENLAEQIRETVAGHRGR